MSFLSRMKTALLGKRAPQQPSTPLTKAEPLPMQIDELPPFSLEMADRMRFDPQVRIGLGARNGLLMAGEIEVVGDSEAMGRWVQQQWDRIWSQAAHQLVRAKHYGYLPFEVEYRQTLGGEFAGMVEFATLCDRPPQNIRLLLRDNCIVGYRLKDSRGNEQTLLAPQALVCTFDADCGNPYGCSLLARAYAPWYEKWAAGGARRTIRLRMMKDAYLGDIFWYPPDRQVQLADGSSISWREIAQQVVDSRQTGSAMTLPLLRDKDGHKLVDYTPPQGVGGATQIFQWKKDLDLEIWKALEIPPEIIQASTSGSGFSGRWIPFVVALSAVHLELAELIRCIDRDILRPLAHLNFGRPPQYEIRPRSLVEIYTAKFAKQLGQAEVRPGG